MKYHILLSLLLVAPSSTRPQAFQDFKLRYDRSYSSQEEALRYSIFTNNLKEIEEHNSLYQKGLVTYQKGVNQFSDLTQEEFQAMLVVLTKSFRNSTRKPGIVVADSVDWRAQGQVTEVKNQGNSGSFWSFAITGTTEAAYYRLTTDLVPLSEQQLIDCCTNIISGCSTGLEVTTYVQKYGLQSEDSYPYRGYNDQCSYDSGNVVIDVTDFVWFNDEDSLLEAVATVGPVAAAIDASDVASYSSGVYSSTLCSAGALNHGVLVVGYGGDDGLDYWIVKNSWGRFWGEDGYLRLLRGRNMCGIGEDNTFSVLR